MYRRNIYRIDLNYHIKSSRAHGNSNKMTVRQLTKRIFNEGKILVSLSLIQAVSFFYHAVLIYYIRNDVY